MKKILFATLLLAGVSFSMDAFAQFRVRIVRSKIIVNNGGELEVKNHGELNCKNGDNILVKSGGLCNFEANSTINL